MDDTAVGVYEVDLEKGVFLRLDETVCEHLGYTQEELVGQSVERVLTDWSAFQFKERLKRISRGETVDTKTNFVAVAKDGKKIPIIIEAFFEIKNGVIVGAIVAARAGETDGTDT